MLILSCLCLAIGLQAQVQFNITGGNVVQGGNFLVFNNASLSNSGTFTANGGTVSFRGDGADSQSTIGGNSETTFNILQINKSANNVLLGQNAYVKNSLSFSSGLIDLQTYNLSILTGAGIAGASTNTYVKTSSTGFLIFDFPGIGVDVAFPVGNSAYNPLTLNNAGTDDAFRVRVRDEILDGGTTGSAITSEFVDRTWTVEEGTSGGSNVTMTAQWNETEELSDFNRAASYISRYNNGWSFEAFQMASGADPYTVSRSGITNFSEFAVSGDILCPTITALTEISDICTGSTFDLTATGLANMGSSLNYVADYGIRFVAFSGTTAPSDPYTGGIDLGTIDNTSLTGSDPDQTAMLSGVGGSLAAGDYLIYAVLSPTPSEEDCKVSQFIDLTILETVAITGQPSGTTFCIGSDYTLSVTATGTNLFYQWKKDGMNIDGATSATLNLTDLQTTDAGSYTVEVSNLCGTITSNAAVLVAESTAPTLSNCPTYPDPISTDASQCFATINFTAPTASDNCSVASIEAQITDSGNNVVTAYTTNPDGQFAPGTYTIIWRATDTAGNSSSCNSTTFTVEDDENPNAVCINNFTATLSGNAASISTNDIDAGSTDNCSVASLSLSETNFDCSNIGTFDVTLTVTDNSNNSSTCMTSLTIEDNTPPTPVCSDFTVQLDMNGQGSITTTDIDGGSTDNCSVASLALNNENFDCTNIGNSNTVSLTVTDVAGNSSTCNATITVEDNLAPTLSCSNQTVNLSSPNLSVSTIIAGSTDNCTAFNSLTTNVSTLTYTCSELGTQSVTITVTDMQNNSTNCTVDVTVLDDIAPLAVCKNATVQLDANGNGTITTSDINNSSSDNCGIASLALDNQTFDCNNLGNNNTVTLTVTDQAGNSNSCSATVTVEDNVAPVLTCADQTVNLSFPVVAYTTIIAGSTDNCSASNQFVPSIVTYEYTCSEVGLQSENLTIQDAQGNEVNCTFNVTVVDDIAPTATCMNATVNLDGNGAGNITTADINNNSTDNCGVASLSLNKTSFDCSNVGPNTVTLTVIDVNGNVSTCTANVTVQDNLVPNAICANVTVQLDVNGDGATTENVIGNTSNDNCGVASLSLSNRSFTCSDLGPNTLTLTVTDVNGNLSTCTSTVTVEDNNTPTALCKTAVNFELTSDGTTVLMPDVIDNGSFNTCGPFSLSLSQTDFDCDDVNDAILVTLTIQDDDNNLSSSCQTTVNVIDPNFFCCLPPAVVCNDITVQLDANGIGSTTAAAVGAGSFADCGLLSETITQENFACVNLGTTTVTYTMTDINNEQASCTATITIEDKVAPTAFCLNTTVEIQADGTYTLQESDVFDAINSFDNCGITQLSFPAAIYDCDDVGAGFSVLVTIQDASGNADNCTSNIQVEKGDDLPDGWSANDVGIVTIGNEYSFDPCTDPNPENGEFTITGSGNNATSSTTDNVAFASQTLCGNGSITAKIESVTPDGYGGLMIRETTDAGAKQVAIFSDLSSVLRHEARYTTNGPKQVNSFFKPSPYWLRLDRQDNWIFAYYSSTGANFQYVHGVFVPMQSCVEIGLASFTYLPNNQTEAVFSNVSISGSNGSFNDNDNTQISDTYQPPTAHYSLLTVNLFPNPNQGQFTIQLEEPITEDNTLTIYNHYGQLIYQQQLEAGSSQTTLGLGQIPSGVYLLELKGEASRPVIKKFTISR